MRCTVNVTGPCQNEAVAVLHATDSISGRTEEYPRCSKHPAESYAKLLRRVGFCEIQIEYLSDFLPGGES
jgi:hypothetical protein